MHPRVPWHRRRHDRVVPQDRHLALHLCPPAALRVGRGVLADEQVTEVDDAAGLLCGREQPATGMKGRLTAGHRVAGLVVAVEADRVPRRRERAVDHAGLRPRLVSGEVERRVPLELAADQVGGPADRRSRPVGHRP